MRFRPALIASLLALGATTQTANAAPCVGFTDVFDTDSFCGAVEWLKNRAVTTGCTATEYCPWTDVSRAAMALFMNRLGKAMTPIVLHKEHQVASNVTIGSPAGGVLLCQFDEDFPVTGYTRLARFHANVYGVPVVGPSWLVGWWKYSTDNGTNWTNVPNALTQRDWADYGQVAGFSVSAPPMELAVGTTYRFALFGSGMGSSYMYYPFGCQIEVVISNHNPLVSPLDQ